MTRLKRPPNCPTTLAPDRGHAAQTITEALAWLATASSPSLGRWHWMPVNPANRELPPGRVEDPQRGTHAAVQSVKRSRNRREKSLRRQIVFLVVAATCATAVTVPGIAIGKPPVHQGDPGNGLSVFMRPVSAARVSPKPLHLVALGDSIPYGQDCGGCTGYVKLYGRAASRALRRPVSVDNRAEHNNLDSARLLAEIRHSGSLRAAVARADIVTLTIGHNDAPWNSTTDSCDGAVTDDQGNAVNWASYTGPCLAMVARKLGANVTGIVAEIRHLRARKLTVIRVTNFHNDNYLDPLVKRVVDGPTKAVVDALDTAICAAAAHAHLPCADVYHAFNGPSGTRWDGRYVAADHVHPNQRGHTLIATLLAKLGYAPLHGG